MENIKYAPNSKLRFFLFTISKIIVSLISKSSNNEFGEFVKRFFKILNFASLILFFIKKDAYPDIFHQLFAIKFIGMLPPKKRFIDYQYLNRTVIWDYCSELGMLVYPSITNSKYLTSFAKILSSSSMAGSFLGKPKKKDNGKCSFCGEIPTNVMMSKKFTN